MSHSSPQVITTKTQSPQQSNGKPNGQSNGQLNRQLTQQTTSNKCNGENKIVIEIHELTLLYLIMSNKTVLIFFNMIQNQLLLQNYYPERKLLLTLADSENKYSKNNENLHKYYRDLVYKKKVILQDNLDKSESSSYKRQFKEKPSFQKNNMKQYFNYFSNKSTELIKLNKEVNKKMKSYLKNKELYNYYDKINNILVSTGTKESKQYSNLRDDIKILRDIIESLLKTQLEEHIRKVVTVSNKNSQNNSNIDTALSYKKMLDGEKKKYLDKQEICINFIRPENNDVTSLSNMMINFYKANKTPLVKEDITEEFKSTELSKFVDLRMNNLVSLRLLMDSSYEEELRKYKEEKIKRKFRKREIFRDLNYQFEHI